jgi:hypothetical protein
MSSLVLTKRPLDVMADLPLAYALDHNCVFAMVSNQVVNRSVRYLFRNPRRITLGRSSHSTARCKLAVGGPPGQPQGHFPLGFDPAARTTADSATHTSAINKVSILRQVTDDESLNAQTPFSPTQSGPNQQRFDYV